MLGAGAAFSTVLTAYRYTNGLRGIASAETDEEEVERRENLKKNRRRPLSETIQELGEGRGEHCITQVNVRATNDVRNLCPRLRREAATAAVGEVWHRCEGCPGVDLDRRGSLRFEEPRDCERYLGLLQAHVHILPKALPVFLRILLTFIYRSKRHTASFGIAGP